MHLQNLYVEWIIFSVIVVIIMTVVILAWCSLHKKQLKELEALKEHAKSAAPDVVKAAMATDIVTTFITKF